jgi:aryl-alcohol dehydrogenase-like predicted oxidoreductase
MRYEKLGHSDVTVSAVGLGTDDFGARMDFDAARAVVEAALDEGITHFDTAEIYGEGQSEEMLGKALEGRRDDVVIATKFGWVSTTGENCGSRAYVRGAIEHSLARLRTDHVDVLYYHQPDRVTPIAETLGAMQELVDEGKVRAIGCSNFDEALLREAENVANGGPRVAAIQNQYSLVERDNDNDVVPAAVELGVAFIPYYPLASGLLTGKYRRGEPPAEGTRMASWWGDALLDDEHFDQVDRLKAFAEERGHTLLELAIAGLASQPSIPSVIAGATRPEQVRENAAAGEWRLTDDELAAIPRFEGGGVRTFDS